MEPVSTTSWFLILVMIALKPTLDDSTPKYIPGDIIKTQLMASGKGTTDTEQEENCNKGGSFMAEYLEQVGGGSVKVHFTCVKLPATIQEIQTKK